MRLSFVPYWSPLLLAVLLPFGLLEASNVNYDKLQPQLFVVVLDSQTIQQSGHLDRPDHLIRQLTQHIEQGTVSRFFADANAEQWEQLFPELVQQETVISRLQSGQYSMAYTKQNDLYFIFMTRGAVSTDQLSKKNTVATWELY